MFTIKLLDEKKLYIIPGKVVQYLWELYQVYLNTSPNRFMRKFHFVYAYLVQFAIRSTALTTHGSLLSSFVSFDELFYPGVVGFKECCTTSFFPFVFLYLAPDLITKRSGGVFLSTTNQFCWWFCRRRMEKGGWQRKVRERREAVKLYLVRSRNRVFPFLLPLWQKRMLIVGFNHFRISRLYIWAELTIVPHLKSLS